MMPATEVEMKTPQTEAEFSLEWLEQVLRPYFRREGQDPDKVQLLSFKVAKNEVQGILSTTYVVDIDLKNSNPKPVDEFEDEPTEETEEELDRDEILSVFVKVPLQGEPLFHSVNTRELIMFESVLPKLQTFLDEKCEGFFRLPMPKLIHCHYDGTGDRDVFVLENLLSKGYYNFSNEACLNEEHMKSVLDCLSYLHGTGLAYKHFVGSKEALQEEFPKLEVQIQLHDLIEDQALEQHFKKHFRAFLHYLEDCEPSLARHTQYMRKMHKHILRVVSELMSCGYAKLITFAHGDAKPNNFMFRKIEIDLEELECEGIEPILIDWQGGFLGSVANDLMWALFPFVERENGQALYVKALEYYHEVLRNALDSFNVSWSDLDLPTSLPEFATLLKRCLAMEFLIVTVVKPIMSMDQPTSDKLWKWHKETQKNTRRRFKKKVIRPEPQEVFQSPRFTGFCHLYFHIATALGGFQELGKIYFQVMKDSMFEVEKLDDYDSDAEDDQDLFSRVINAPARTLWRTAAGVAMLAGALVTIYCAWQHREWIASQAVNIRKSMKI